MAVKPIKNGIGQKPIPFYFSINQFIKHHCKMIDFIKLEIFSKTFAEKLENHELLDFKIEVNKITGELTKQVAKFQDMEFIIYQNKKITIAGSLHKYFNEGQHNHNDFNFQNLENTILKFCQTFDFNPELAYIRGIEFGVNINTERNPSDILNMLVCYKNKSINRMQVKSMGDGRVSQQTNQILKIYNKSLQFGQPKNILRIEQKVIRMRKLKKQNIRVLSDLLYKENIEPLGVLLFEMFESLIIHEPIKEQSLTPKEQLLYLKAGNPRHWLNLQPSQRFKMKRDYNKLISIKGTGKLKETITKQIIEKWDELLKYPTNA